MRKQCCGGGLVQAIAHELVHECYLQPSVAQELLKCMDSCANKPNDPANICHISSHLLLLLQMLRILGLKQMVAEGFFPQL